MARVKNIIVTLLAAFFIFAGVMHFVADDSFAAIVPPLLPFPYLIVWVTGLIEIGLAVMLLCPHFRARVGILLSLYLLAVLPANIYMATSGMSFGSLGNSPALLWGRVAMQFPLIALVLWVSGALSRTPRRRHRR